MALKIGISLYTARIRSKRSKDFLPLDRFDGRTDFYDFFRNLLVKKQGEYIDLGDTRKRAQLNNDFEEGGRAIDGTIDVGEYGLHSLLRDELGLESFERLPVHAEMITMYYRAWFPEGQKLGAFALQNYGSYGCKGAMQRLIEDEFRERFPDFIFEMREAISKDIVNQYLTKGIAKEFTFLQHGVPADWADGYGGEALTENEAELEIKIKAKRGKALNLTDRIVGLLTGGAHANPAASRLFEVKEFECESFKIKMEVDGQQKTLSHSEFFNMTSRMDVSAAIKRSSTGHPERESIRQVATRLLIDLAENIVLRP